jgi:hypothetical protein
MVAVRVPTLSSWSGAASSNALDKTGPPSAITGDSL